jgi:hypothetical protein
MAERSMNDTCSISRAVPFAAIERRSHHIDELVVESCPGVLTCIALKYIIRLRKKGFVTYRVQIESLSHEVVDYRILYERQNHES